MRRKNRIFRSGVIAVLAVVTVYFSTHVLVYQIKNYAMPKTFLSAEVTPEGEIVATTVKTDGIIGVLGKIFDLVLGGNFADTTMAMTLSGNFTDIERPTVIETAASPPPENTALERTISGSGGKLKLNEKISINNETSYLLDESSLLDGKPAFKSPPKVLIVHTHSTESYHPSEAYNFTHTSADRSTDNRYNMIRIGEELKKELSKQGIEAIHITELFDYPEYNNSYARSCVAVENILKKNKDIQIVLDLHRDAIVTADKQKTKIITEIDGEKVAQLMLVVGTDELGLAHDNWRSNLKFAVNLQRQLIKTGENLARPINLRTSRFNGHTAPGAIIVEVGATGNTMEEALRSTKYLAEALKKTIK